MWLALFGLQKWCNYAMMTFHLMKFQNLIDQNPDEAGSKGVGQ
jgi:hypothetical protein